MRPNLRIVVAGLFRRRSEKAGVQSGSALVIALITIAVLGILVASMGFEAQLQGRYARYVRNRTMATRYSLSGIEIAKMLMARANGAPAGGGKTDEEDRWHLAAERLKLGQSIIGLVEPIGDEYVILDIEPEPGRLNVNMLTRDEWETILGNAGIPEDYFDAIIDPILDWIDADDTSNPEGAETEDYYSLLDPPYEAKNGPFDTVRELLLVKGFSEPILTGGTFDPLTVLGDPSAKKSSNVRFNRFSETNDIVIAGIEGMLTTYGDGKINIQSAPYDVLRTLPGVDDILARAIMEERNMVDENGDPDPFRSEADLFNRVDGLESSISSKITVNSNFYRITATGRSQNVEHQVWCIAYADGKELHFLRWVEEP